MAHKISHQLGLQAGAHTHESAIDGNVRPVLALLLTSREETKVSIRVVQEKRKHMIYPEQHRG